jgi:hypothetical protein
VFKIQRTQEQIDAVLEEVAQRIASGASKFPGMSYEQGINEMWSWLISDDEPVSPMED